MMAHPRVFVSHSHLDNEITDRVVADLRNAGADVWYDRSGIYHGDFVQQINDALSRCDWVVLVQSPNSLRSPAVQQEVNAALNLRNLGRIRDVIPLIVAQCNQNDVPALWTTLHHYDATQGYAQALRGLLVAIELALPLTPPVTVRAHPQPLPSTYLYPGATYSQPLSQPYGRTKPAVQPQPLKVPWILSKEALIIICPLAYLSFIAGFVTYGTAGCEDTSGYYCVPAHPGFDIAMGLMLFGMAVFLVSCLLVVVKMCIGRQWLWLVGGFLIWPIAPLIYAFAGPPDSSKSIVAPLLSRLRILQQWRTLQELISRRVTISILAFASFFGGTIGLQWAGALQHCHTNALGAQICSSEQPGTAGAVAVVVVCVILGVVVWLSALVVSAKANRWWWFIIVLCFFPATLLHWILGPRTTHQAKSVPVAGNIT